MNNLKHKPASLLAGAGIFAVAMLLMSLLQASWQSDQGLTAEQREILSHMSIVHLDDGSFGTVKTIRISGVNVQVVNGTEETESTNGLGNIIVGYNELHGLFDDRTGSHNLVVGSLNDYGSFGGLVGGREQVAAKD